MRWGWRKEREEHRLFIREMTQRMERVALINEAAWRRNEAAWDRNEAAWDRNEAVWREVIGEIRDLRDERRAQMSAFLDAIDRMLGNGSAEGTAT